MHFFNYILINSFLSCLEWFSIKVKYETYQGVSQSIHLLVLNDPIRGVELGSSYCV